MRGALGRHLSLGSVMPSPAPQCEDTAMSRQSSSRPGRPDRRTTSLAEVVIVVTIMGIVAAIAQPRLVSALERDRVRRSANKLTMDLRLAQSEAIRQQQDVVVGFNTDYDAYQVTGLAPGPDKSTDFEVHLGADPDYRTCIDAVTFGKRLDVTFDRYGAPDNGGTVVLGIRQTRITVTVDAGTGRTTVGDLGHVPDDLPPPTMKLPPVIEYGGEIDGGDIIIIDPPGGGGEIDPPKM